MTSDGKVVKGTRGGHERFLFSLVLQEGVLAAGKYTLLIDPVFNKSATGDYKKVVIDFFTTVPVNMTVRPRAEGQQCLEQSLKREALEHGQKNYYLANSSAAYANNVYRISNIAVTKAWYGVMYCKVEEECKYPLKETFRPKLSGLEV